MTRLASALLVLLALGAPAASAQQLNNPQQMLQGFSIQSLQALMNEAGFRSGTRSLPDGTAALDVVSPNDLRFVMIPSACNSGRCAAVRIIAFFTYQDGVSLDGLNEFNNAYAFIKAFRVGNDAALSRYITADFGIPRGNVVINVAAFESIGRRLRAFLQPYQDGEGQPGDRPGADTAVSADVSFEVGRAEHETTPKIVQALFADGRIDPDLYN